jgi:hypothetical protein
MGNRINNKTNAIRHAAAFPLHSSYRTGKLQRRKGKEKENRGRVRCEKPKRGIYSTKSIHYARVVTQGDVAGHRRRR